MKEIFNAGHQFVVISKADFDAIVADAVLARMASMENDAATVKVLSPERDENEYLTRKETAQLLHVHPVTLSRWAEVNYLLPVRAGRRVLYNKKDVMAILEKGGGRAA